MKKLINGILDFRKNLRPIHRETFAKLALEQKPDSLFIACSDSRVVPNLFASTDPGDLFVIRNVGNLIPPCGHHGVSVGDESELAALEFAIFNLKVKDIVVCGHSECGAMRAICDGRDNVTAPHLRSWLQNGQPTLDNHKDDKRVSPDLALHNKISQLNVLTQLEHLKSYPFVSERIQSGELKIHGWWFDIGNSDVYVFDNEIQEFVLIDEFQAKKILDRDD